MQTLITADGQYKPCCKYKDPLTHQGEVLKVQNGDSISKAWSSDDINKLRQDLKNNLRPQGCSECWREEDMGVRSMRYDSFDYMLKKKQVQDPNTPKRLEINASNVCNLKCRICSSSASTKWQKEEMDILGIAAPKYVNLNEVNTQIIKDWLPNIIEIGLFGGEPFLSDENLELLRYCVDNKYSSKITILANTNGTVYSDEIISLLKKFKKVYLNFSIDDIEDRFEYQRKGAKWESVTNNMKNFVQHGGYKSKDKIEIKINCTVSIFNVYYLSEYFLCLNEVFPGIPVYINLLYNPEEYSVQVLPDKLKKVLIGRIKDLQAKKIAKVINNGNLNNLLYYLERGGGKSLSELKSMIERHDKYRKESFEKVFPELNAFLQQSSI